MFSFIKGRVIHHHVTENKIIIETVSGIGYEVVTVAPVILNQEIELFLSYVFSETAKTLFGFETAEEKYFFELLRKVNKVGPVSAFNLLTQLGIDVIINAILTEQATILSKVKGIGGSTSEKIILDLKKKISAIHKDSMKVSSALNGDADNNKKSKVLKKSISENAEKSFSLEKEYMDAFSALESLGYQTNEIIPFLKKWTGDHGQSKAQEMVEAFLKGNF